MKPKTKKLAMRFTGFAFACLFAAGSSMTAYGAWSAVGETYNYISTAKTFGSSIEEIYNPPDGGVFPGIWTEKSVQIKNTGDTAELVRAKLTRKIGVKDGNGNFAENPALDPEVIHLDLDLTDWKADADGWYYYTKVLDAGASTSQLLKGFTLDESIGNEYQYVDCQIIVDSDVVQYEGGGIEAWGKTYLELGIPEPSEQQTEDRVTNVVFIDPDNGFDITTTKEDLFANFKDVLPGTTRIQEIKIQNQYDKKVAIDLVGMVLDENLQDPNEKLYRMLTDYMTVTLTDADRNELYTGPVGGQEKNTIKLGEFEENADKSLFVTLSVKSDMTKEYQDLMGSVKWMFAANNVKPNGAVDAGEATNDSKTTDGGSTTNQTTGTDKDKDTTSRTMTNVQTGDMQGLLWDILLMVSGSALVVISVVYLKKRHVLKSSW